MDYPVVTSILLLCNDKTSFKNETRRHFHFNEFLFAIHKVARESKGQWKISLT